MCLYFLISKKTQNARQEIILGFIGQRQSKSDFAISDEIDGQIWVT